MLALALILLAAPPSTHLLDAPSFEAISSEYSGERAQEDLRRIVEYHRIQGSPMMRQVAEQVVLQELKAAGIESKLETFASDGKTRYGDFVSPMAWDMRGGELWVTSAGGGSFTPFRLCRYADVPMCVTTYSKGGDWSGQLVDVGAGTSEEDYAGKDLNGKVALGFGYASEVIRRAVLEHGAVGVVIYPPANDRPDHPDMVRYNGAWTRAEELDRTSGGFQISANQHARLVGLMKKGPVTVHGSIDAALGAGDLTLVDAWIRGTEHPEEEILLTAHLDHPKWSANDNASGSAGMLELVRSLHNLIAAGKLKAPRRTLHFLWVPEFFGTAAWVANHPEARRCGAWDDPRPAKPGDAHPCIVANLNLDMIGEDTVKTNSRFYMTRVPDSVPSSLDALLEDAWHQTAAAELTAPTGTNHPWVLDQPAYLQGSDHDIFLGLGIPASMFGHDPEWTHHTSEDTPDKTDPTELKRCSVVAATAAWFLANADNAAAEALTRRALADHLRLAAARAGAEPGADLATSKRQARSAALAVQLAARLDHEVVEPLAPGGARLAASLAPLDLFELRPLRAKGRTPKRKQFLPFQVDPKKFDSAGQAFVKAARERLDGAGPGYDVVLFETVNFMNGRRDAQQIADALSDEFGIDLSREWVEQLVAVLASQGYVDQPR